MAQNYYTLLKLNVDTFVKDPAELDRQLETVKQEWNRSNNTDIRAYVSAYYTSGVIKEAYPSVFTILMDEQGEERPAQLLSFRRCPR